MANSAESYGGYIFSFLRNLLTIFDRGCTSLHSHQQQCMRYKCSFFPRILLNTWFSWSFDNSHSDRCEGYLIMVLICIFLMVSDAEYLFLCLLTICMSFFGKMSIKVLCPFFNSFLKSLFLFLAALGRCCCTWAFSSYGVQGLLSN